MAKPPSLLSEVRFGAFLVYSPRGSSEVSQRSRRWRDAIKYDRPPGIAHAVERLSEEFAGTQLGEILGPDVAIVPSPKSSPLVEGALWPARRIADELVKLGLGKAVIPCVRRAVRVPKSAFSGMGERPSAKIHLESLAAERTLAQPSRIAVVDDIVTKGVTLLAVASLVKDIFPEADIRVFAVLRTLGLQPEVERILDPCVGTIRLDSWGEPDRQP